MGLNQNEDNGRFDGLNKMSTNGHILRDTMRRRFFGRCSAKPCSLGQRNGGNVWRVKGEGSLLIPIMETKLGIHWSHPHSSWVETLVKMGVSPWKKNMTYWVQCPSTPAILMQTKGTKTLSRSRQKATMSPSNSTIFHSTPWSSDECLVYHRFPPFALDYPHCWWFDRQVLMTILLLCNAAMENRHFSLLEHHKSSTVRNPEGKLVSIFPTRKSSP